MSTLKDLVGQRFGKLTAISDTGERRRSHVVWLCECDCGGIKEATSCDLQGGNITSCGCLRGGKIDLVGRRVGRLTVISEINERRNRLIYWVCKCDCGNTSEVSSGNLLGDHTKSCGCLQRDTILERFGILGEPPRDIMFNRAVEIYKKGARTRGYCWELSNEECGILFKGNCVYCGLEPSNRKECQGEVYYYSGIDRVNNKEGYKMENCVSCCWDCNNAKRSKTREEFVEWAIRIVRNQGYEVI